MRGRVAVSDGRVQVPRKQPELQLSHSAEVALHSAPHTGPDVTPSVPVRLGNHNKHNRDCDQPNAMNTTSHPCCEPLSLCSHFLTRRKLRKRCSTVQGQTCRPHPGSRCKSVLLHNPRSQPLGTTPVRTLTRGKPCQQWQRSARNEAAVAQQWAVGGGPSGGSPASCTRRGTRPIAHCVSSDTRGGSCSLGDRQGDVSLDTASARRDERLVAGLSRRRDDIMQDRAHRRPKLRNLAA